jgi:hypothetical protein
VALGSGQLQSVPAIIETTLALRPRSIVDLGMGSGKYGYLLREQHDIADVHFGRDDWRLRLVGVEGYSDYVGELQRMVYDEVVTADVMDFLERTSERFDAALALDILEHFEPERGAQFIERALDRARFAIISSPRGFYQQDQHENVLERHMSWWPARALRKLALNLGAQIAVAQDRYATIAVLSRTDEPQVATQSWREVRSMVRSALLPEVAWCRLTGKAGPTISM